jgi:hypothetical protein
MAGALHGVIASLAGRITDAFFRYVSLLLNTTSTNGAQNNTFLDSSANNFSITRNGNTTQGTFSPFSQTGWSNFFDGTGDFLTAPSNAAFAYGTGDFTWEAWIYPTSNTGYVLDHGSNGGTISYDAGRLRYYNVTTGIGGTLWTVGFANTPALNTWHHIAAVRSGGTTFLYFNGVLSTSATDGHNYGNQGVSVGQFGGGGSNYLGYVSNLRLVKGTAVYTSAFTPPTSPLTNITNTSLLTCQSNRFIDNSSNAFAITPNGDVSVQAFSPFNPTAAWDASTNGGSGYFDGTGDYLSIADSATIRFGTGTFTIQGWVYRNAAGATHTIAAKGGASTGWVLQITSTNVLRFTDTTTNIDTTTTIPASTWTHVAVVRTGTGANGLKLYINAVDSATGTSSTDFNQTEALNIGADRSNANAFNGYIASLKYTVGTAESISVPTAPATGGTVLCNFTNAGIFDSASGNDLETVGNAQVSTTVAKWGTTSMAFDGTGDWLLNIDKPALRLGAADFTIEGWVYLNAAGVAYGLISKGAASTGWSVNVTSGNKLQFSYTATQLTGATSLAASTWYHFAVVRSGSASGNLKVYLNGTADATSAGAVTDNFNQTNIMYVGADRVAGSSLNGYIDDLRITNGYARYTSNFTAPTAAFPLQ